MKGGSIPKFFRVNQQIKVEKVHLIDEKDESQGVVSLDQALLLAHQRGYDLVEVASSVHPPVCRLLDFGKYKYKLEKERRKKKTKALEVKQIRTRLSIEPHDLEIKKAKVLKFLEKGHKVKITVRLKGRERIFLDRAYKFLDKFQEILGESIEREEGVEKIGNRISILLSKK